MLRETKRACGTSREYALEIDTGRAEGEILEEPFRTRHHHNARMCGIRDTVQMDREKVRAILDSPRPSSKKRLRAFVGLSSYLSRFIKGFTRRAGQLYAMTGSRFLSGNPEEVSSVQRGAPRSTRACARCVRNLNSRAAPRIFSRKHVLRGRICAVMRKQVQHLFDTYAYHRHISRLTRSNPHLYHIRKGSEQIFVSLFTVWHYAGLFGLV